MRRDESFLSARRDKLLEHRSELFTQAIATIQKLTKLGLENKIRMRRSSSDLLRPFPFSVVCSTLYAFKMWVGAKA